MQGRIVKGIAGFYYVDTEDGIFECRAKGIFRNQKVKPLVGDLVELEVLSQEEKEGSVISILPRKSELIRPAVANVDQALVIFALSRPTPNLPLLDRFLIMMKQKEIPTIICFNKSDMVSEEEREHFRQIYRDCGSKLLFISAKKVETGGNLSQHLSCILACLHPSGANDHRSDQFYPAGVQRNVIPVFTGHRHGRVSCFHHHSQRVHCCHVADAPKRKNHYPTVGHVPFLSHGDGRSSFY